MEQPATNIYSPSSTLETIAHLRSVLGQVMHIETHIIHDPPVDVIEFVGQLTMPSDEAFDYIYARFTEFGYTPMLTRRDDGKEIVVAKHGIIEPTPNRNSTNVILLILTIISTLFVGIQFAAGDQLAQLVPATADFGQVLGVMFTTPPLWLLGLP
ncbi:MAG TPA: hypothetical protein VFK30_00630, partial [Anaerolineae bacterium]|nr:hypothetical protein [Anaerolineae bacterium]